MKNVVRFKKPYGLHVSEGVSFEGEVSLAMQSSRDECDINSIMKKYQKTGLVSHTRTDSGRYGDFFGADDYQEALNTVLAAQESFLALPSSLRTRFQNDPAQFLDFINDSANHDEAVKLGLIEQKSDNDSAKIKLPPKADPIAAEGSGTA